MAGGWVGLRQAQLNFGRDFPSRPRRHHNPMTGQQRPHTHIHHRTEMWLAAPAWLMHLGPSAASHPLKLMNRHTHTRTHTHARTGTQAQTHRHKTDTNEADTKKRNLLELIYTAGLVPPLPDADGGILKHIQPASRCKVRNASQSRKNPKCNKEKEEKLLLRKSELTNNMALPQARIRWCPMYSKHKTLTPTFPPSASQPKSSKIQKEGICGMFDADTPIELSIGDLPIHRSMPSQHPSLRKLLAAGL